MHPHSLLRGWCMAGMHSVTTVVWHVCDNTGCQRESRERDTVHICILLTGSPLLVRARALHNCMRARTHLHEGFAARAHFLCVCLLQGSCAQNTQWGGDCASAGNHSQWLTKDPFARIHNCHTACDPSITDLSHCARACVLCAVRARVQSFKHSVRARVNACSMCGARAA